MAAVPGILRRWNPGIIPGLQFWVDATDNSSISSNANGTVNSIRDKSANSVLMAPQAPGNQPTMAIGPSGNSVIEFTDGLQDLRTSVFPKTFSNNMPISQISIFNIGNINAASTYFTVLKSAEEFGFIIGINNNKSINFEIFNNNLQLPAPSTDTYFIEAFYNSNTFPRAYALYDNGVSDVSNNTITSYVNQLNNFKIEPYPGQGSMCELIFYNKYHYNTLYMRQLEGYLAWKWNITNFLPLLHPYKNRPPS